MSLESWKGLFETVSVWLLFLTFVCGAGALYFSNRVNKEQAAKLREFDKDLTDAKTELGKQQERAAAAEASLLELQRRQLPRMLSAAAIEFMKGKSTGTAEIMYKRDDSEASLFAEWVFGWLGSNGWKVSKPTPIPNSIPADKILEVLGANPLGVTVAVKTIPTNPKRDDPYSVLMDGLAKSVGQVYGARAPNLPIGVLRIIVMQKP